jgi:ATP-dependent Zn protease
MPRIYHMQANKDLIQPLNSNKKLYKNNKDTENKDRENKDTENKDRENKDIENKDIENKDYYEIINLTNDNKNNDNNNNNNNNTINQFYNEMKVCFNNTLHIFIPVSMFFFMVFIIFTRSK